MSAPKGNQYAAKPARERRESRLNIPVTSREKATLVKRAKGQKLADFVRRELGLNNKLSNLAPNNGQPTK